MQSSGAPGRRTVLAVDIGGTKIRVALVGEDAAIVWSGLAPTPRTKRANGEEAERIWATVESLCREAMRKGPAVSVGAGCGGPMEDDNETVSPLNIPGWRSFPLRSRLARLTALPVTVDNDAKSLALAEGLWGAATGEDDYMSMVVSTGVGGGMVVDGRLLHGRTRNAGHIGHVIVNPGGRVCGCGARGCLEAEASGTAIEAVTGRPPVEAGPEVIERAGRMVGRAVGSVANLLDLRLATVAGSVALGYGAPFFDAAQEELDATARLSFSRECRIVASGLGPDGPVLGAAALALGGRA
jgi:glucokinase